MKIRTTTVLIAIASLPVAGLVLADIWTEDMFVRAMKTGKHMGSGRDILPPMPWQAIAGLTEDDLKAIYAYLRTIPAIRNEVPRPTGPNGAVSFE
jgi:hypothetical protein